MQKNLVLFIVIILIVFSSGCAWMAPEPTPAAPTQTPDVPPVEETITLIPTFTPELDQVTEAALRYYPLFVGSTWVSEFLGYDQNGEVVWRVVETVTENRKVKGYFVAVLKRHAEVIDGEPPPGFQAIPATGTFWYLVDGENLYRFEDQFFTELSEAWLDLVLPFPEDGQVWYPDPDLRAESDGSRAGFRFASDPYRKVLPTGGTHTCYNVSMVLTDGEAMGTFCEGVGFVYQEFDSENHAFGHRYELKEFFIQ
jgi:hypothetical protein